MCVKRREGLGWGLRTKEALKTLQNPPQQLRFFPPPPTVSFRMSTKWVFCSLFFLFASKWWWFCRGVKPRLRTWRKCRVSAGGTTSGRSQNVWRKFSPCNSGIQFGVSRHIPAGLLQHMRVTGPKWPPHQLEDEMKSLLMQRRIILTQREKNYEMQKGRNRVKTILFLNTRTKTRFLKKKIMEFGTRKR